MLLQNHIKKILNPNWSIQGPSPVLSEKTLYRLGRSVVELYSKAMLSMDIWWHAPLPDSPKILAANHPTTTDPFLIMLLASEQVSVLVTEGCFNIPVFGPYLLKAGHVPVVRNSGGATVEAAQRLLQDGRSVAIFPEGAISPADGGFHKPHSGVARLAVSTGAPVIPVGIGLQRERIRRIETEVDGKPEVVTWYPGGPYAMTVGQPMQFSGDIENWVYVRSVAEQIMQCIIHLSGESAQRLATPRMPMTAKVGQPVEVAG
jgi:1-acyl-sn-glycerol-3-phosphate acyltransferase